MRKILILSIFFIMSPLVLLLSILFLSFMYHQNADIFASLRQSPKVSYAALPKDLNKMMAEPKGVDARVTAVKQFLSYYKSPLLKYSDDIVASADKYGIDYRLLPAIAMQESTLCKKLPVRYKNTHNCWGFGIYGKKVTSFESFDQAIDIISKTLAVKYKALGLSTPEEIMSKYNPVSVNGAWANGVSGYMDRLDIASISL